MHIRIILESAYNTGDPGSISGLGKSSGGGDGSLLQYTCQENPMGGGTWQATVHGVARVGHDLVTKPLPPQIPRYFFFFTRAPDTFLMSSHV